MNESSYHSTSQQAFGINVLDFGYSNRFISLVTYDTGASFHMLTYYMYISLVKCLLRSLVCFFIGVSTVEFEQHFVYYRYQFFIRHIFCKHFLPPPFPLLSPPDRILLCSPGWLWTPDSLVLSVEIQLYTTMLSRSVFLFLRNFSF
jgi:hypothetical protein